MNRIALGAAFAAALLCGTASAQTTAPVAPNAGPMTTSPTGGIPSASGGAADRTGSITETGQTKPPGDSVGERLGTAPELERKSEIIDQKIKGGICRGC